MNIQGSAASLRNILTDALHYWEPRRIPYNLVLVVVVIESVILAWPHSRNLVRFSSLLPLFVLAVIANICYTAAYTADVPVQPSAFRAAWQRWRWLLWGIGTAFAAMLAFFWMVDEVIGF